MEIVKLMKETKCDFPTKKVGRFDPWVEYLLLDEEQKRCFILRSTKDDKIEIVNLKYASPDPHLIDKSEFNDLCEQYTLLELPHFTGGSFDYTSEIREEETKARKEMFKYLLDNGYFDC